MGNYSSESFDSESQSRESDTEDVHCLITDAYSDISVIEVFDFDYDEFTRDDLFKSLNDMVKEYKKLFQSFEEVKFKNQGLTDNINSPCVHKRTVVMISKLK